MQTLPARAVLRRWDDSELRALSSRFSQKGRLTGLGWDIEIGICVGNLKTLARLVCFVQVNFKTNQADLAA